MSMNYKKIQANLQEINNYITDLEMKCLKKTIFFTGSDGYLGARIKQRLVQAGHTVISWNQDLTQEIKWDTNSPALDLIIHFGTPDKNILKIDSKLYNSYSIALDQVTENIYNLAKQAKCPIINASTDSVKLDIPIIEDLIKCEEEINYKDIKTIHSFNTELTFLKLPRVTNLRVPLVLDESILEHKPNSWYAGIRNGTLDDKEIKTFYKDKTNIPILSLDRFCTITLVKIYEVLKETGTKEKFNQELFEYPSINLKVTEVVSKIRAGFWK